MLMQLQCDCLYYRVDKDMFGGEGWRWGRGDGSLQGIMIITITHRTAEWTYKDRAGTGLCHLMFTRTPALCIAT